MKVMLDSGAYMPEKAHETDAGYDLRSMEDKLIPARGSACFDLGVHVELPAGTVGMLKSKSGLNVKHSILSAGVIDAGYTGSIVAKLYNNSDEPYHVFAGDKVTQLVIIPLVEVGDLEVVERLSEAERGDNGFGSTGR
ncbi:MAG: dUTP diphosphatase [Eubacteriales bacterium]|nr:dUTP diphosphatase [Eubacteriales bacterium]